MKPTQQLRAKLDSLRKASQIAEVKAPPPPKEVKLSDAAAQLPEHIRYVTDAPKLNAQTPFFKCPSWADLPSKAYHLYVTRDGVPFPALELQRFPFYLFGKSNVCDYALEHLSISSIHAAIVFHKTQNCFVLVDLGSTNGSRVDGKLVEPRKPVPLPVGAVLRFGFSTREYTVCAGPPPSAKRIREEQEELVQSRRKMEVPAVGSTPTDGQPAVANSHPPAAAPLAPAAVSQAVSVAAEATVALEPSEACVLSSNTHEAAETMPMTSTPPPPPPAPTTTEPTEVRRAHLFQLVIKHKDVKNPVSKGRNKGEVITRSSADARQMAQFILRQHETSYRAAANELVRAQGKDAFIPWTVEEFTEAVLEYCEMSNPKKKGDLGVVEEGMFAPAFDRAAFALRRHEVSPPVETELGIHLIFRCD